MFYLKTFWIRLIYASKTSCTYGLVVPPQVDGVVHIVLNRHVCGGSTGSAFTSSGKINHCTFVPANTILTMSREVSTARLCYMVWSRYHSLAPQIQTLTQTHLQNICSACWLTRTILSKVCKTQSRVFLYGFGLFLVMLPNERFLMYIFWQLFQSIPLIHFLGLCTNIFGPFFHITCKRILVLTRINSLPISW